MSVIARFFVVLFAFFVASMAAGAVLVLGAVHPVGFPVPEDPAWPVIWFLIFSTTAFVAAFSFVPAAIMMLLAESFAWRSAVLYALAGGAISLVCGYSFDFIEGMPDVRFGSPLGTNFELFAAAGIAAGFVYWLIAGRNAGKWRHRPEHATPQS